MGNFRMKIKPGVSLAGLSREMQPVLAAVDAVYGELGVQPVITSGSDGEHGFASRHYVGDALDFRTRTLRPTQKRFVAQKIAEILGPKYDVVAHATHLHVEYDPKGG